MDPHVRGDPLKGDCLALSAEGFIVFLASITVWIVACLFEATA
jgi:hypothetical protein